MLTVSIRCTAESSAFRRASIVDGGSRPLAALRGVGRFIVAGRLPISGKTVGRTGGAIFGFISHYKRGIAKNDEARCLLSPVSARLIRLREGFPKEHLPVEFAQELGREERGGEGG